MKDHPHDSVIAQLLSRDTLLGKLNAPAKEDAPVPKPEPAIPAHDNLAEAKWARKVLSEDLCRKISSSSYTDQLRKSLQDSFAPTGAARLEQGLNSLFRALVDDVAASRDQLLALNPGRREAIEKRLEFIARKIARHRNERWTRSISLTEVLKDSYREDNQNKIAVLAWKGFVAEVAMYHFLELFFLKCLDVYGWRKFDTIDLSRMNYCAHTFLSQRAVGFAHDKHCWNFVRMNLYSWYVPSTRSIPRLANSAGSLNFSWSDQELMTWIQSPIPSAALNHLNFSEDRAIGDLVAGVLEKDLGVPLISNFQGRPVCQRFFIPALELGGTALALLDRVLAGIRRIEAASGEHAISNDCLQLNRAIWACESESFEAFWTEVLALLKLARTARNHTDFVITDRYDESLSIPPNRIPHALHVVRAMGIELHNLEQLPLRGSDVAKSQEGSAAQIQQNEAFDGAVVLDHPERTRTSKFMRALAEQVPYWRDFLSAGTNLNWGETHLHVALSKLRNDSVCLYLSHRMLPDGADGDKFRKSVLGLARLEFMIELNEEAQRPYRYLYVFRRTTDKTLRDSHRPLFGNAAGRTATVQVIDRSRLEESSATQAEIAERGWDHIFVRGAAPLVRHLGHKFPKLFQLATVQTCNSSESSGLFAGVANGGALEITTRSESGSSPGLLFSPVPAGALPGQRTSRQDHWFVFAHNPIDLPWIECLLNSPPAQFWIRQQILSATAQGKMPKFQDLRSCPILDLSRTPSESVHEALGWLGTIKPDVTVLRQWACDPSLPVIERHVRYVALAKRYSMLERIVLRYRPLFTTPTCEELRPESVTQFYPASMLTSFFQSADVRIHYVGREKCNTSPENWIVEDLHSVVQPGPAGSKAYTIIHTSQGPTIQILMPAAIKDYVNSQLHALREHTWSEVVSMVRIPRDVSLFQAQSGEIKHVVAETAHSMCSVQNILEELALDLFEISPDFRQFLPH